MTDPLQFFFGILIRACSLFANSPCEIRFESYLLNCLFLLTEQVYVLSFRSQHQTSSSSPPPSPSVTLYPQPLAPPAAVPCRAPSHGTNRRPSRFLKIVPYPAALLPLPSRVKRTLNLKRRPIFARHFDFQRLCHACKNLPTLISGQATCLTLRPAPNFPNNVSYPLYTRLLRPYFETACVVNIPFSFKLLIKKPTT